MAKDTSVGFLYPDHGTAGLFTVALARLLLVHNRVNHVLDILSGPDLAKGRNLLVETFLKETTDRYLLMLDSDMVFTPQAVAELHNSYDKDHRDHVIGGYCVTGRGVPTLYTWKDGDFRDPNPLLIPDDTIVKVDGTGAACLLVPRSALEKLEYGTWFDSTNPYSEDLSFCLRLKEAGVPLAVHTGAKFGHCKGQVLWPPTSNWEG